METKDKIKQTLLILLEEYPADDVTIKMFCMESGLSKQTLYNHYGCLMDALEDAYRSDFAAWLAGCDTYHDWVEGFRKVLELLHDKRGVYLHVFYSSRREDLLAMIDKYGRVLVLRGIDECAADQGYEVSSKDRDFMVRFYMNVFMGIVGDYIKDRMREDPAYIASRCDAMMHHHIRQTLANLAELGAGTD